MRTVRRMLVVAATGVAMAAAPVMMSTASASDESPLCGWRNQCPVSVPDASAPSGDAGIMCGNPEEIPCMEVVAPAANPAPASDEGTLCGWRNQCPVSVPAANPAPASDEGTLCGWRNQCPVSVPTTLTGPDTGTLEPLAVAPAGNPTPACNGRVWVPGCMN